MRAAGALLGALALVGCASAWADAAPARREAAASNGPVLLETMKRLHSLRRKAKAEKAAAAPASGMAIGDATSGASPSQYRFSSAAADTSKTSRAAASSGQTVAQLAGSNCKICIYVLERIKQGYQYLLPSICVEIWSKTQDTDSYGKCHNVLASLSVWGHNVRHWLQFGCYKTETYGAMELIKPCPSHVICSQMADLDKKNFCAPEQPYEPS